MSVEILKEQPVFEEEKGTTGSWFHDAIHDIESLFWVITFICLVRAGPGMNISRRELRNAGARNNILQGIIYRYFDPFKSDRILWNKENLFHQFDKMDKHILLNFHSYFEPLKEMINQWWQTLLIAYRRRRFEYYTIHDQILDILDKAIKKLPEGQDRGTGDETRRREVRELESINKEPSFSTSGNHESGLDLSPERPICVPVPSMSNTRLRQEHDSASPRHRKKQKKN